MTTSGFNIEILDQQTALAVNTVQVRAAVEHVLTEERVSSAEISVAFVDDATIHKVNHEFLGHDYPTDVISFLLNDDDPAYGRAGLHSDSPRHIEAELIVSTETARREAAAHGWSALDELLLYVIHGTLHLCGYDDLTDEARPIMRDRERQFLARWHLIPTGLEA